MYGYYGAEHGDIFAVDSEFPGINTPQELYAALMKVWCKETCSPSLRDKWSPDNKSVGQCAITALLVQDIFGGEVYGIALPNGAMHCYNEVAGRCIDLASEQFGEKAAKLRYDKSHRIDRAVQLADGVKLRRYMLLRSLLKKVTSEEA